MSSYHTIHFQGKLHIFSKFIWDNINTSRVTTKHYSKIILSIKVFIKWNRHFQRVIAIDVSIEDVLGKASFCPRSDLILKPYWLGCVQRLPSEKCLMLKMLKIASYSVEIFIFCYDYKHLPFSNKPYQPEMKFSSPFNIMTRTVASNSIT